MRDLALAGGTLLVCYLITAAMVAVTVPATLLVITLVKVVLS